MTLKHSAWLVAETNASSSFTGYTALHRSCMIRFAPDSAPRSRAKYGDCECSVLEWRTHGHSGLVGIADAPVDRVNAT